MKYKMLFSPMKIGSCEIKNRVVMSPMLMNFGTFDGTVTQKMIDHYTERAKGGAGLIITEITRINDRTGASSFNQLAASKDYHIPSLKKLADSVHTYGAKLFVQLHHPGRQNIGLMMGTLPISIGLNRISKIFGKFIFKAAPHAGKALVKRNLVPRTVAPSKVEPSYFSEGKMRALRKNEIKKLIGDFISAAERVRLAGCDGVMLHAAHGYLIQQFLSPYTNKRKDEYGGSFENRMRFLSEIISGIKQKCPGFPLTVRLSVDECYDKIGFPDRGYNLEEGVRFAIALEKAGVNAIDVSCASYDTFNYWLEPISFEPGWRKYMAKAVKEAVSVPVIAANLIRSPQQAEEQLSEGVQDFVSLGRPHLADPCWANKAFEGREREIKRCINCLYCFESMQKNAYSGGHGCCAVNPLIGNEHETLPKDGNGRSVVIVGAGPAGLTAAANLTKRGFHVVVFEKESFVGGQTAIAAHEKSKSMLAWCADDLRYEAEKNGAIMQYGAEATVKLIHLCRPYAVIIAAGGAPAVPRAFRSRKDSLTATSVDIITGKVKIENSKVCVIGSGLTGLETARILARNKNAVTVVEMADSIAPGAWMQHVDDIMPDLNKYGVTFITGEKLVEIAPDCITLMSMKGKKTTRMQTDKVVFATGISSEKSLYFDLKASYSRLYLIGDAKKSGRVADAVRDGYNIAKSLN